MSFQEVIKEYYILPSVIILCFPAIFPFNNYQFQVPDNFKISRIWSYPCTTTVKGFPIDRRYDQTLFLDE